MAPKEKPKGPAQRSSVLAQAKPPPKGAAKAKGTAGASKAKSAAAGQVAVPKGRLSAVPKPRTSGRLSGPIDPGAIEKLDSPRPSLGGGSDASAAAAVTAAQAPSGSASVASVSDVEEFHELRQERDELQAENIRLQRKASQANAVVTKVNDLMDRFQLRDKQQRKELEAAQEQASEHATLQAEHRESRKSLTGLEQHAALLEEQLTALRGPNPEDSALSLKASLADTEELESELAESRKGNLFANMAMARAKSQLMHQKEQVEEIAHLSQSELAEVAEVKLELEEAIRGRQLYEEEASSERKICQRLQSEAVSGAIGASELESQAAGEGGLQPWMWRWARLAFLAHSDSVDRSCAEFIHATAEATARKQRAFSFGPGARDAVQLAPAPASTASDSSPTASADSVMALALQEALAGVQEAKATMSRALQETEAECAYWASRARQLEERAEQAEAQVEKAEAQVRELKEAVLKASALGRASAERPVTALPSSTLEAPADAPKGTADDKDSVKVTVLKMQLAALRASKSKAQSPPIAAKKFKYPTPAASATSESFDLDAKVEMQCALDDALYNLTQEQNALHAAQAMAAQMIREHDEEAFAESRQKGEAMQHLTQQEGEAMQRLTCQESEAMQRLKDEHRSAMKTMESNLAEDFAAAEEHHRGVLMATEATWTQATEELLSVVKNADGSTQTAMSEYEEAGSARAHRESQHSGLVSELNEAVFSKLREVTDLQSELKEVFGELQDNALEEKVQEMESLVQFHEHMSETAETERDHLQEEMFKCMEDSLNKTQEAQNEVLLAQNEVQTIQESSTKIRDHLLAELAVHGADMEAHAQTTSQLEAESKATAFSSNKLATALKALDAAEESSAAEHSLKEEAQELQAEECRLYSLAEEKISDMFESSKAEEEECAELASIRERAVAAEHATQQAHSAECSLYRLAEEGRVGAKRDLEEYTKERRLLEELLEEKTEEAERLGDEVDELRGFLDIEKEKSERIDSLTEVPSAEDTRTALQIHQLREELMEKSQAGDAELCALRDELNAEICKVRDELDSETQAAARNRMQRDSTHSAAGKAAHGVAEVAKGLGHAVEDAARGVAHSEGAKQSFHAVEGAAKGIAHVDGAIHAVSGLYHRFKDRPSRVRAVDDSDQLEVQHEHVLRATTTPPSAAEKTLQMEVEQERLATVDTLTKLYNKDIIAGDTEERLQLQNVATGAVPQLQSGTNSVLVAGLVHEQDNQGVPRAMQGMEFAKLVNAAAESDFTMAAVATIGAETMPARGLELEVADPEASSSGPSAAEKRLQMELEQERLARADALAELQRSHNTPGAVEQMLRTELEQERQARESSLAKVQGSPSDTEQRLRRELEQERLARADAVAKLKHDEDAPSTTGERLGMELEPERLARAGADVPRAAEASGGPASRVTRLVDELRERDDMLSSASAEVSELQSERARLLQDLGLCSELRMQNAALRFSLENRIEQSASLEEMGEAKSPSTADAASAATAASELRAQQRERMRWASEVEQLRQELEARTSEARQLASRLSEGDGADQSAVAHAVQQEFAQEWASEAALMKTAEDAQLEAVTALAEYAEELQEHETLLQAASLQASQVREEAASRQAAGGRSSGSRSGSILALRTQVGQLEKMLDESCREQGKLESVEAAAQDASEYVLANDPSIAMQQAVASAFNAQQAAAVSAEHFTSETSELRAEMLRLVNQADSADRAVATIVASKIQVAALVKLIERAEAEAIAESGQPFLRAAPMMEGSAKATEDADPYPQSGIKSLREELSRSQSEHFDAISENFTYAEQLEKKNTRFQECASELSDLRHSAANLLELRDAELRQKEAQIVEYASELAELHNSTKALADSAATQLREQEAQSAEVSLELAELRISAKASADSATLEMRMKELTCKANVQAENELCAWWEAQSMQQEARSENLQQVLQNMATTEIDEVNRLKQQLAAKEGQPHVQAEGVAAAPSVHSGRSPDDGDSFRQAAAARMAQPALVGAAAGHIASLAADAARKAAEAKQMVAEAELRNDEELQVHRDLCAHWEAVSMSHNARAEQLQAVEVKQARKATEQLHGEEARAAKMHTWDHLLAARVSAEEALVAELRGEVNALSGKLETAENELQEKNAEYRDLHEAEEHHATKGLELHGQLHFQGSECLEVHATASQMETQVALMQRRLSEQSAGFRKFEDVAAHELMEARAEVQHESSRMLREAAELRSETAQCGIVSAQEAASAAAHASALCDAQLTAHKVHADHNAEHECLRVEHGSEVQAAQEHQEVSARLLKELEEHQHELMRTEFVVQEYQARAQVHHDIAEVRAVELGDLKRRLSTEEEAWWSSERACAMAHGALERVAESQGRDSTARTLDFDSSHTIGQPSQGHGQEAVADIVYRAPTSKEHIPHSVVAADVALGQAMCTLQNAADSVMDAHFGLRNSPQRPHEDLVQIGSYIDLGRGDDHVDEPSRSSLGWLLPPSAPPSAPPDDRLKEAESVLIMAGAALRASADALRDSRSDLERATLRHNMQSVRCFSLSAGDSTQLQAGPSSMRDIDNPMMAHSADDAEPHSRSRLTAAAQGVFIAAASKKSPATMEDHAADLERRAHAQLRSEHFLLEAEIASERHEASSLQAKVEQLQLSLISEEHRSAAGSNAAREEMSVLKQEQALQLQEATVRLWELSHHLEDRSSTAKSHSDGASVTDAARLHSMAATEVHRAEAAEESARERYEELQRLILGASAMNDVDGGASPASAADASFIGEQSLEEEDEEEEDEEEEPVLLHSAPAITLAEVEIEAMQHQEESQALQQECAEMLEEIRQHAPGLDLAHGIMSGALPDAADLHRSLSGADVHGEGLWISAAPAELSANADQLCRAVAQDSQQGSAEMQQLALHAQHLVAAAALKHRGELLASEEECELLRKSCEHHRVSEKHMQAAASAGSAEAQELAAYLAVEEAAWRASHETSFARQNEHAKANQHLEELCQTLTQRNLWLSETELDTMTHSLSRQRQESAELQDCLRLADVQAESTTAKLADVNLKQQAFVEECDAREASLLAELAALREDGDMELARLRVELKQREDSTEESCREFEQKLQQATEQREAELRDEVNSETRKCAEFMEELETCIRDLADLQGHASELTELHRMRDTRSLTDEEELQRAREEILQETSMRSIALETQTEMQEALVIAKEEQSQLEEALIKRQRRVSDGNEAEIELRQARTEIDALEQVAELHAQHSLKVHRLMCEDAQQRVGGGSTRPVRNSALRQWQARVADQSQVLLERSWTLLHRPDSPTAAQMPGTPTARSSEMADQRHAGASTASLRALEDARGEVAAGSVAGSPADTAT